MSTHTAIAISKPTTIDEIQVPTSVPGDGEVLVRVEYSSLVAFDTYMADLGYMVSEYPVIPGLNASGRVAKLGAGVTDLVVGDRVVAFCYTAFNSKGMQQYTVLPRYVISKVPDSVPLEEAVTIPDNLITAFYTLFNQLELPVPSSFPTKDVPPLASAPILIYGAGSTTGQYLVQLLRAAGYTKILAVASERNHAYLKSIGATDVADYKSPELVKDIAKAVGGDGKVPLAVDCIAAEPSLAALAEIVSATGKVAILLPVKQSNTITVNHASEMSLELSKDTFPKFTKLFGVRTFTYHQDSFLKDNLALKIIPSLLETGIIQANRVRLMDQGTFKERVSQGMDLLRHNKLSGEKVVVKIVN